jgi:probable F420-dependent oxidoreductase
MRIGLALPNYGRDAGLRAMVEVSRSAEDMGYDSLWTGDRLLAPLAPQDAYPGGGVMPPAYRLHMDPLVSLAFATAHTSRVRIGTSTLNALWQPPLVLARQLTSLDVLSGGRLDIGIGLGWLRDEYQSVNVPWQGRGARLEETLDLLETYWTAEVMAHEGNLFEVPPATVELRPAQRPRPPVLLAAFSSEGLRRIARRADGWLPVAMPLDALMNLWGIVEREASDAGRDPAALRMALRVNLQLTDEPATQQEVPFRGTFQQYVDYARAAAEAGVHELFLDPGQTHLSLSERVDLAGRFLEGVRRG